MQCAYRRLFAMIKHTVIVYSQPALFWNFDHWLLFKILEISMVTLAQIVHSKFKILEISMVTLAEIVHTKLNNC